MGYDVSYKDKESYIESQINTLKIGAEFGYKGCEKGWNIEKTMIELEKKGRGK